MNSTVEKRPLSFWLTHPYLVFSGRVLLGTVFVYASLDKIRHPELFAEAVYNYQLLPEVAVNLVAIWLPWLELVSGGLLLLGLWVRGSILVLSGLMVIFLGSLGINLARGLDIYCGCFSTHAAEPMTILTLIRDAVFLILALYLFWLYQIRGIENRFSLGRVGRRE
ncbi:MAG: DoxX family membrane protein [Deltaproteobacteria bacterium]|nr:MAG: DoxX family membrane protein [Deltaproteobacteria bacterium]